MKAVELTNVSWILIDPHENNIGILVKKIKSFDLITKDGHTTYATQQELEKHFGEINFKKRPTKKHQIFINEMPVDVDEIFNIDETFPSYTKSEKSKIRFAAGYWGVLFSNQYVIAFCPKCSTLEKYKHIGPFKDRMVLQSELSLANKKLNDEL